MSDLEDRLRALEFQLPEPEWRREILAQCPAPHGSWKEWLWPSPLAWAALALVWCALGLSSVIEKPAAPMVFTALERFSESPRFALQTADKSHPLTLRELSIAPQNLE